MDNPEPEINDGPATCRTCGHEFKSYAIKTVDGRQMLFDLDGDLIFELEKTCHFCNTVFPWHSSYRAMRETTKAFQKLQASLDLMHTHQLNLDNEK